MRYILTTLLLLIAASSSFALTLQQAIDAALQNHQRIEQFRAGVEQAEAAVGSAQAAFLPKLDLGYNYLERDEDPYSLGDKSSTLGLSGSINLFNGLTDYHSYRAAQKRAEGANYRLRGTRADIVLATEQAYIEVLRAARSVATASEGVELLQRQRRDTELKYQYGLLARNDLLRIDVELSSAKQDLLSAEGQQRIARRQLERTIGMQLPVDETPAELTESCLPKFDPDQSASYRELLLENRSELNYLRSELAAVNRERRANKGDYLPRIDLTAAHEEYGDDLSPTDDDDNLLKLQASWSLFDGFAREKAVAASTARARAVAAELRDLEASLQLQLETALQNLRIADGRLLEAATGVASAEENYRVTENRFQQQQATTVDLLDAQYLLTRARNLEINARYDLYLSEALLERILEQTKR
ncbi:Outer membrane protein TolC [Malonomonas rubra DSM 5091]|uniref:Outer membrane protein TolC n=1 Tax=Malonomonas rubra DSM 5091 TaxID=1122189 RepID=A0A1M6NKH9_MALRU|nr:TolC family protein [Malonomonas rubra]SHJ96193.1 Outer membrane protein TolC [Malonomonas rubra DSM 5091]